MRICIVGKFPPIQGGVSMRTYWTAHALAARGHDVHVVTNAKEVRPPFRMHMRAQDWERCEPKFDAGAVTAHWTDPLDRSQSHIPIASPFVSKLATLAANAHAVAAFDVIYSHYMEPYGIAGHLAAQMTGAPHVVRLAGSDAGRLWHHPQFEALYDHVLRSAAAVVVTGSVADRAAQRGVEPGRIVSGGGYALPQDLFTPHGPTIDAEELRAEIAADPELHDAVWGGLTGGRPCFGVYGKLGARKGSFALLEALRRMKLAGAEFGLLALAHGNAEVERQFRDRATELGLTDRILQIPFLPHWRVSEFLRGCVAVCCLEQDFPIGFHSPIIPREVLLSGTCLVGSSEVIRKLPGWQQLPHGYGCVALSDVNDIDALAERLSSILRDPRRAKVIGARGRAFATELERSFDFPGTIEGILTAAAERRAPPKPLSIAQNAKVPVSPNFALTRMAAAAVADAAGELPTHGGNSAGGQETIDLAGARRILKRLERAIGGGRLELGSLAQGVRVEIAIAVAERDADKSRDGEDCDPLFRLHIERWALDDGDLAGLVPVRASHLRFVHFEFDVAAFRTARNAADLPAVLERRPSHVVVFGRSACDRRDPLVIDDFTAQLLELCDGARTAGEIVTKMQHQRATASFDDDLKWIEHLFVQDLIQLRNTLEGRRKAAVTTRRRHRAVAD